MTKLYRKVVLEEAARLISEDRNIDYGDPMKNFRAISEMWSAYTDVKITPHDVAVMMILVKVARLSSSPRKQDSWIDIAGYAALGAEIVG